MGSRKKKKLVSTKATSTAPPRGSVPSPENMAATMSRPTASYTPIVAPLGPRLQLPPLLPTAGRSLGPSTSVSRSLESPTTSLSSSTSWSISGTSHTGFYAAQSYVFGSGTLSENSRTGHYGGEHFDRDNDAPHGIKRPFDATKAPRYSYSCFLTPSQG